MDQDPSVPLATVAANLSSLLFCMGGGLLAFVLFYATIFQGSPIDQLGIRQEGRGLWSFLLNDAKQFGSVGVRGYDPVLGAFAPTLRLCIHLCFVCILGSATNYFLLKLSYDWMGFATSFQLRVDHVMRLFSKNPSMSTGLFQLRFVPTMILIIGIVIMYMVFMYVIHQFLPGVSHPGGPRTHAIERRPKWKTDNISCFDINSWSFCSSAESHRRTENRWAGSHDSIVLLTGEPAGRDVWIFEDADSAHASTLFAVALPSDNDKYGGADERLVQELASGGRSDGSVFQPSINPNSCDYPLRSQLIRQYLTQKGNFMPPDKTPPKTVKAAVHKAVHFFSMLQTEEGYWSGDYGGPMFLMPGLVAAWYIMGRPERMLNAHEVKAMQHYMIVHQQADGGWGTHIESPSTMFGTTLNYVALRLTGMDTEDPIAVEGRKFIQSHGGALMTSSWAKFTLCMLGCMHWDGHNSVPPEMWILPNWFPFHPGRMWCHARMVYLPMGYIYGSRFVYDHAETDPLILALRKELYCEPYASINWSQTRHWVALMDNYSPISSMMRTVQNMLFVYESSNVFRLVRNLIRQRGLAFCAEYMAAEDLQTNYIDIGPVNKVFNMIAAYHLAGGDIFHSNVVNHMARVQDYLWLAEDGMKMKGYNGSQCWDTSFAIQAISEAKLLDDFPIVTARVWNYLEKTQILSTEASEGTTAFRFESKLNRLRYFRHVSQGGWPFSTSAHGWPISDCSAEGLKAVLCLLKAESVKNGLFSGVLKPIGEKRIEKAVNVLLSYQNEDGGWATYENLRGFGWYESLNPSEVFGDIMIDYSYAECSMAALTALIDFRYEYPCYRSHEVHHAITKGCEFLKHIQRADGSWYGSWACCFTYGCWFGVEGLVKCGEPIKSDCIVRACNYLLRHQRLNGGWGENFSSCYNKSYSENGMDFYGDDGSGVVNTAWALLALSIARCDDLDAVKRGVRFLITRQLPHGDWPQEGIAGVFNRACGISYASYRNVFPIWALSRCREVYGILIDM